MLNIDNILEIVQAHAVDGKFRVIPKGVTMDDLAELNQAGLLTRYAVSGGYEYVLNGYTAGNRPAAKVEKSKPVTGLSLKEPEQNEHYWAMVNSKKFAGVTQAVGCQASMEIGSEAARKGVKFSTHERELTKDYLARQTGFSARACQDAMKELVKQGFFVRTDNGKGGRGRDKGATYRVSLPDYS